MNQNYEPHQLVIKHISVLETAPAIAIEVEKKVFAAIDEKIKNWVESQGNWEGVYNFIDEETTIKPILWEKDEKQGYYSWYSFGVEEAEEISYNLSPLLGVALVRYGLWFGVNASFVTSLIGRGTRPNIKWATYLAEIYPQTGLAKFGFELQSESLFLPILVDAQILADSYPDSLDVALEPVDDALKKLENAHPQIDDLLTAAQTHFRSFVIA